MNIHRLGLHMANRPTDQYTELWFELVASAFYKRMIANLDLLWREAPDHAGPEESMVQLYLDRFDILEGGSLGQQAIMIWESDEDICHALTDNKVKMALWEQYNRLYPFKTESGCLENYEHIKLGSRPGVTLCFKQKPSTYIERIVASMEAQLASVTYDEIEERRAIHPVTVPPLKERLRRAQKLMKDTEAQTSWAAQQKKSLCDGICSSIHKNVRSQTYDYPDDPPESVRWRRLRHTSTTYIIARPGPARFLR